VAYRWTIMGAIAVVCLCSVGAVCILGASGTATTARAEVTASARPGPDAMSEAELAAVVADLKARHRDIESVIVSPAGEALVRTSAKGKRSSATTCAVLFMGCGWKKVEPWADVFQRHKRLVSVAITCPYDGGEIAGRVTRSMAATVDQAGDTVRRLEDDRARMSERMRQPWLYDVEAAWLAMAPLVVEKE